MKNLINKTVYTKGMDGLPEKWYLETILDDGTCLLRKSQRIKWIDTKRLALTSTVYQTRKQAILGQVSIFI